MSQQRRRSLSKKKFRSRSSSVGRISSAGRSPNVRRGSTGGSPRVRRRRNSSSRVALLPRVKRKTSNPGLPTSKTNCRDFDVEPKSSEHISKSSSPKVIFRNENQRSPPTNVNGSSPLSPPRKTKSSPKVISRNLNHRRSILKSHGSSPLSRSRKPNFRKKTTRINEQKSDSEGSPISVRRSNSRRLKKFNVNFEDKKIDSNRLSILEKQKKRLFRSRRSRTRSKSFKIGEEAQFEVIETLQLLRGVDPREDSCETKKHLGFRLKKNEKLDVGTEHVKTIFESLANSHGQITKASFIKRIEIMEKQEIMDKQLDDDNHNEAMEGDKSASSESDESESPDEKPRQRLSRPKRSRNSDSVLGFFQIFDIGNRGVIDLQDFLQGWSEVKKDSELEGNTSVDSSQGDNIRKADNEEVESIDRRSNLRYFRSRLWFTAFGIFIVFSGFYYKTVRVLVVLMLIIFVWYVYNCFLVWEQIYCYRTPRTEIGCPSNKKRPIVYPNSFVELRRCPFSEQIYPSATIRESMKKGHRRRGTAHTNLLPNSHKLAKRKTLSQLKAGGYDMDHVYIRFAVYLWGMLFIYPNWVLYMTTNYAVRMGRINLIRMGWLSPPAPIDFQKAVGMMALETCFVLYFTRMVDEKDKRKEDHGKIIGEFVVPNFAYFDWKKNTHSEKNLVLRLDLKEKRMVSCFLGPNREISPKLAHLLLMFDRLTAHVIIHALANWGLNPDAKDPFIQRMSQASCIYNYLGFTGLQNFWDLVEKWGITDVHPDGVNSLSDAVNWVFIKNLARGITLHSQLIILMKYSELVDYVIKLRNFFLIKFEDYREDMAGIDGEALYVGTVLHSLDHSQSFEIGLKQHDYAHYVTDVDEFRSMASMVRYGAYGMMEDLPLLSFDVKYRDAPHPFFRAVYERGAKLNKKFADIMDCCIIK